MRLCAPSKSTTECVSVSAPQNYKMIDALTQYWSECKHAMAMCALCLAAMCQRNWKNILVYMQCSGNDDQSQP